MRALWTGAINFGLVNIPVKLFAALESKKVDLHYLRRKDLSPIRFAKVSLEDGKEVAWEDIVKGYEYEEGEYVVLEPEDLEAITVEKTHNIEILAFVKEAEVDEIFYNKPYYIEPQKFGLKSYALLREALKSSNKVGIARFVFHNREHIGVIKPHGKMIMLDQLYYADEMRSEASLKLPKDEVVPAKELKMAKDLIGQLSEKFKPEKYHDNFSENLKKLIEAKAKGKAIRKPKKIVADKKVKDIMALLKKSIANAKNRAA